MSAAPTDEAPAAEPQVRMEGSRLTGADDNCSDRGRAETPVSLQGTALLEVEARFHAPASIDEHQRLERLSRCLIRRERTPLPGRELHPDRDGGDRFRCSAVDSVSRVVISPPGV